MRQDRVGSFPAPPGPPGALHHERDKRLPAVDVESLGASGARGLYRPVLTGEVAVGIQLFKMLSDTIERQPGDCDQAIELLHHLGPGQDRQ